ncbi:mevalonate kinase [Nocardia sp. NPDC020380]|uniref:mevalonate kinase n=1 Tax=Nocardia sp. NPDC020380 TaxID=3364309 RepID=UPI0037935389
MDDSRGMRLRGTGHAHAKVILIGEHTVVHGTPAIAVPVPRLQIDAIAYLGGTNTTTAPIISDTTRSGTDQAVQELLRRWGITDATVDLRLHIGIPPARGLGGSAACTAAAVRAVAQLCGRDLDAAELYDSVQFGERIAHGRASGIDTAAVIATDPIRFERGESRPAACGVRAGLIIADSGIRGETRPAVAAVAARLAADPRRGSEILTHARELVEESAEFLSAGRIAELGRALSEFHRVLGGLGVSLPRLDHLAEAALRAGAHGAKLTGGGLGGCVIALADPDTESQQRIRAALTEAGAIRTWVTTLGGAS